MTQNRATDPNFQLNAFYLRENPGGQTTRCVPPLPLRIVLAGPRVRL